MPRMGLGFKTRRTKREKASAINSLPFITLSVDNPVKASGSTYNFTVTRENITNNALTVTYTVAAVTTDNSDMVAGAGAYGTFTVNFVSGETTKTFSIATVNNGAGEADEFFNVTLEPSSLYDISILNNITCTTVGAPALPTVSITNSISGAEGTQNISVTFTRTGSTAATLDLTYRVAPGTGGGYDPIDQEDLVGLTLPTNQVVQFGIGNSTATITLTVNDDALVENTEGVDVSIVSQPLLYTVGSPSLVTIPISDNEPPGPQFETTTLQNFAEYNGVRFNFNINMPVGYFIDGQPFVVNNTATAPSGFNITSITPASVALTGGQAHGTMRTADITGASGPQGFDELMNTNANTSNSKIDYLSSLNIDPGNTAAAISVAANETNSFIKSVRVTGLTGENWQTIDRYTILTVLNQYPLAQPFRPSMRKLDKTIPGYGTSMNFNVLRSLAPVSGGYTIQNGLDSIPSPVGPFPTGGDEGRRWRVDKNLPNSTSNTNYGRDTGSQRAKALQALHCNYTNTEKRTLFIKCIQLGIDTVNDTGWPWTSGAGQWHGALPFLYLAAFALNSSSLLTIAKNARENMNGQHRWVQSFMLGKATGWPTGARSLFGGTWQNEQIDQPAFRDETIISQTDSQDINENSYPSADYRFPSSSTGFEEMFYTLLLQNGPGGETGVTAILGGGLFDKTNFKAAAVAYMDTFRSINSLMASNSIAPGHVTFYDTYRTGVSSPLQGTLVQNPFTTSPEQVADFTGTTAVSVTAGSGSFSWSWNSAFYTGAGGFATNSGATEVITSVDLRYSMDQRSWTVLTNTAATGTVSGLIIGQKYYVQFRRTSASGTSPWSPSHPRSTLSAQGNTERNTVTPTGTGVNAAPANASLPQVTYQKYPNWAGPSWETAPATLLETTNLLFAGVGLWTGFPTPTFTYQWQRNGVNIDGAIDDFYLLTAADVGQVIRVIVSATNSQGGPIPATSAGVTVPTGTGKIASYYPRVRANTTVEVATTADITLSGIQTLDSGTAGVVDQRVLVKNQTLGQNNGIYLQKAGAWVRASDADTWNKLVGTNVTINSGTQASSTTPQNNRWSCTNVAGGTLGTTPITWQKFGATNPNFTKRWDALAASPIQFYSTGSSTSFLNFQTTTTTAIRFWSLDFVQPIGSLTAINEGLISFRTTGSGTAAGQRIGIVCRASGANADGSNAQGYLLEWEVGNINCILSCLKYTAGTPTAVTLISGNATVANNYDPKATISPNVAVNVKYQFYMSGTNLVLQAKIWRDGNTEPGWQAIFQDASPHAAGLVGIASRANKVTSTARRVFNTSIDIDITATATISTQEEASLAGFYY